ncbi:MAG: outer membrane beta-barrel protein, partial [Methylocystis sp.]
MRGVSAKSLRRFTLLLTLAAASTARAADQPPATPPLPAWNGFYFGGHMGYAGGRSNWSGPDIAGSSGLAKPIDTFTEAGSFLGGFQGGYNFLLPSHLLMGLEADFTFPAYPDLSGQTTGASANFISPTLGAASYTEAMQTSGTVRGRVGYVFNDWLVYGTGGFAWARTQQTLTQTSSGTTDAPFLWRSGWVVGGGLEVPLIPNWTARLEYLYSNFGSKAVGFPNNNEVFRSDFAMHTARLGLNYQFGNLLPGAPSGASEARPSGWTLTDEDRVNFHAQATLVGQGYPRIRAASDGPNSLPLAGDFRQTTDVTLYAGLRLWKGAEIWVNPEIDQGFGVGNTHGAAGFPSAEAYKLGDPFP